MKFTLREWEIITHALEVAKREYEKTRNESPVSTKETSFYQIFNRQAQDVEAIINKIKTAEV